MASWLVSNMAGWLKAEFSTCRITLKVVIYRSFFYKSQKPRINRGAYIYFFSVCFSANKSNCWQFYEGRRYTLQSRWNRGGSRGAIVPPPDFGRVGNKTFAIKCHSITKGQLISKCLFGIFNSSKKQTKKFDLSTYYGTSSWIVFVLFWEELETAKRHFEINCLLTLKDPGYFEVFFLEK